MDETILIIDDSPFIVEGLAAILTRKGYTPISAPGGEEGLTLLQTVIPDLILLDIMMEPIDGWETLEKIRANPLTKDIPVLMFSAKKITPAEAQEHSMSIDNFISKPVSPAQLMESIQKLLSRKSDLAGEVLAAQSRGIDPALVGERSALRKRIEVDRNLLTVLRASCGMDSPGCFVAPEDAAAVKKLGDEISENERRLKEIDELFA